MAQLNGLFRLGRDAELRYTSNNTACASLALAYEHGRKDPATGNRPTQWINATLWGDRAQRLTEHLTKGKQIYAVLSDPSIQTFSKSSGETGHAMVANVDAIEFVSGQRDPQATRAAARTPQTDPPHKPSAQPSAASHAAPPDDFDDDIPF